MGFIQAIQDDADRPRRKMELQVDYALAVWRDRGEDDEADACLKVLESRDFSAYKCESLARSMSPRFSANAVVKWRSERFGEGW